MDDRRAGPPHEERRWPDRGPGPGYGRDTPAPQARRDDRSPDRPFVRPSERLKARAAGHTTPQDEHATPDAPALRTDGERLSKRMTALGLASRREADTWIEAGWVRVDGKMAVLGQRVGPDARIEVDAAAHQQQAQRVTILLNKPIGYVSGQAEDGHEPAVVLLRPENQWAEDKSGTRWHPGQLRGLAPAGRLDIDSVGLLVLTQDGRVARQLIGEDSTIEKEYLVRVVKEGGGQLSDQALALLNHGLELDGHKLKPAKVSWANEDQLRFVLREGRKRQIRRMCELVGLTVVGLKRVRIGSVVLGHLPPGQWRYLRREEFFG
ncbi:pseudouridine synthase [Sphaerotilus mobilis]|nr:pseudouridine synthase [Sphaerotilus mobilis]